MLLTLRVTEERKRISTVATHRVRHIDIDRAVGQDPPIADQFMTMPHAAAAVRGMTGRRNLGSLTEDSCA
jgi:hypothetical protein